MVQGGGPAHQRPLLTDPLPVPVRAIQFSPQIGSVSWGTGGGDERLHSPTERLVGPGCALLTAQCRGRAVAARTQAQLRGCRRVTGLGQAVRSYFEKQRVQVSEGRSRGNLMGQWMFLANWNAGPVRVTSRELYRPVAWPAYWGQSITGV